MNYCISLKVLKKKIGLILDYIFLEVCRVCRSCTYASCLSAIKTHVKCLHPSFGELNIVKSPLSVKTNPTLRLLRFNQQGAKHEP